MRDANRYRFRSVFRFDVPPDVAFSAERGLRAYLAGYAAAT